MSVTTLPAEAPRTEAAVGVWRLRLRRFRRHRPGMIALGVLLLLVAFALAAYPLQWLTGIDPDATDLLSRFDPPSVEHWLGTDEAGRDVLMRLMVGGQISLLVGLLATLFGGILGLLIGIVAGYFGGKVDAALMRFTDGMITLPLLPLLIVLGAVDLTKLGFSADFARSGAAGFWRIVVIIALVDWTAIARIVRAATLSVKERDYVRAARASGAGAPYVMLTHVLPNVATPIIVAVTLTVGRVILFESVLSFLGFGVVPPTPSWGNMLNNAQELVTTAPALAVYPGLLIFLTVIAVNFLGDGLQHAFDPRSER
ncbi:ABC transporter permease [Rhodovastum atsumiense]|uniref:ABC transporter permease n=1 Tax=Rhodovastum atsumiense TaxID=504468 RepID=A0A5M6J0Y4_9PROT|nr:ABC transporter permease [Rhodovastum atsumiense]KAA5614181.1 ABC transporter permease [Rhodovastum atsumiense]CAH2599040.1 ABC transporter permease [Rhodovastum atsumiense]